MIKVNGLKVKELRRSKGLAQGDLAGLLGYTAGTISYWEKHNASIKLHVLKRLAEALDTPQEELKCQD